MRKEGFTDLMVQNLKPDASARIGSVQLEVFGVLRARVSDRVKSFVLYYRTKAGC
jgi:hypothetical protein